MKRNKTTPRYNRVTKLNTGGGKVSIKTLADILVFDSDYVRATLKLIDSNVVTVTGYVNVSRVAIPNKRRALLEFAASEDEINMAIHKAGKIYNSKYTPIRIGQVNGIQYTEVKSIERLKI